MFAEVCDEVASNVSKLIFIDFVSSGKNFNINENCCFDSDVVNVVGRSYCVINRQGVDECLKVGNVFLVDRTALADKCRPFCDFIYMSIRSKLG